MMMIKRANAWDKYAWHSIVCDDFVITLHNYCLLFLSLLVTNKNVEDTVFLLPFYSTFMNVQMYFQEHLIYLSGPLTAVKTCPISPMFSVFITPSSVLHQQAIYSSVFFSVFLMCILFSTSDV